MGFLVAPEDFVDVAFAINFELPPCTLFLVFPEEFFAAIF
jgi:hypothetical protein